jgi:uncharacterized heparinase superfamily protein
MHLKPSQVFWRLRYAIISTKPDLHPCPELRQILGHWALPIERPQSFMRDGSFKFLNKRKRLETVGWDGPECEKLWRYNQHYFDDLNATCASERYCLHVDLMRDWTANNPPGEGTGWEPYPTSLRIVNWIKWGLFGHAIPDECLQCLAVQTRVLNRKIEWHILGNHLFANAKALVFAGLFFEGVEAEKWLKAGLNILSREMREQILPDGGHFELSPMYHSIVLEDVLDLINLLRAVPCMAGKVHLGQLEVLAADMLQWLDTICHPDGEIAFFNDAAFNIAPSPADIRSYSKRLGINPRLSCVNQNGLLLKRCPDSGYAALEVPHAKLLLDVASIGPDYLPGHGHADTLSFEMSLFKRRVFVNRGTSQYGTGLVRQEERGTAAHNTVVINNENSSEVWSGFRVARRARPFGLLIDKNEASIKVICSHDGYKRLSGSPIHRRAWTLASGKLVIEDKIEGAFESAKAYFHLHPDTKVVRVGDDRWTLRLPGCNNVIDLLVLNGLANIEPSIFSPEFGVEIITQCLSIQFGYSNEVGLQIMWDVND